MFVGMGFVFVRPSSKGKSGILHRRVGADMLRVWIFDALVGGVWLTKAYLYRIFFCYPEIRQDRALVRLDGAWSQKSAPSIHPRRMATTRWF